MFTELLDFDGCEIYTMAQPDLTGMTFGEALLAYETSSLIGLCDADGQVTLNPPADMVIKADTRAILIAGDGDTIAVKRVAGDGAVVAPAATAGQVTAPERTLILG